MHQPYTPWSLEERVRLVAIFDELQKRSAGWTARRFGSFHEVPYSTFCRWLKRYRDQGARGLTDRSHAPRRRPSKLSGAEETLIRRSHQRPGCGVHRLYAYLKAARLTTRCFASVYRVLRRCGALQRRRRRPKPNWILYAKAFPGERAQMDIKYLPEGRFQLTLIDDCSRLTAATVMPGRTQRDVVAALPRPPRRLRLQAALHPDGQRLRIRRPLRPLPGRQRHSPCPYQAPHAASQRQGGASAAHHR